MGGHTLGHTNHAILNVSSRPRAFRSDCSRGHDTCFDDLQLEGILQLGLNMRCQRVPQLHFHQLLYTSEWTEYPLPARSGVVSTSTGTNSGQCVAETGDDEYIKNTMTVTGCTPVPGCGAEPTRASSSCSTCDGLAFVASSGICTGCMNDADKTPITQDNVGNLSPPAEMCTSNSAAKHFTLSIVTMFFALLLQGAGHF